MADPEKALKELPPESPPPEIVLAAVRVFRYRALAVVALGVALVIGAVFVYQRINVEGQFSVKVATARVTDGSYFTKGMGDVRTVDGFHVVVWEIVGSQEPGKTFYVHLLGWDPRGRPVTVEMTAPRIDGAPAEITGEEAGGSSDGSTTLFDQWVGLKLPAAGLMRPAEGPGLPSLTFQAEIMTYGSGGTHVVATVPFRVDV